MQVLLIETSKLAGLVRRAASDGHKYAMIRSSSELAVGTDPFNPTHVIDFESEMIRDVSEFGTNVVPPIREPEVVRHGRRTGRYSVTVKGEEIACSSLKDLLANGLKKIEEVRPGTLEELSSIKPRSKRIVARQPHLLFEQKRLADRYAERLNEGWWYGTNNSEDETRTWLKRAAEIAELSWGVDMDVKT